MTDQTPNTSPIRWRRIKSGEIPAGRVLLLIPNATADRMPVATMGQYNDDRYAKRPRPFWTSDLGTFMGRLWSRDHPPTHWAPPPSPHLTDWDVDQRALLLQFAGFLSASEQKITFGAGEVVPTRAVVEAVNKFMASLPRDSQ